MRLSGIALATCSLLLVGAASAHAGGRAGGRISLAPVGTIHADTGSASGSKDTATAFALGGLAEVDLAPSFSVGFAPQLLLNVKAENGTDSAKELDLLARATAQFPVENQRFAPYAFASLGYSVLLVNDWPDELDRPAGMMIGGGAGLRYEVAPKTDLVAEVSYQKGMQSVSEYGETLELDTSYLIFAGGLSFDL